MELTVGAVLEGKVKSLAKFGAFISLPEGQTGLVHISEVAATFVNDIREHLTEGQTVKVMVIGTENGKINLSIRRTLAPQQPKPRQEAPAKPAQPAGNSFDEMMKRFLNDSNSKMSESRIYSEHKTKTRKR